MAPMAAFVLAGVVSIWTIRRAWLRVSSPTFAIVTLLIVGAALAFILSPDLMRLVNRSLGAGIDGGVSPLTLVLALAVIGLVFAQYRSSAQSWNSDVRVTRLVQSLAISRFRQEHPGQRLAEIVVVIPAYNEEQAIGAVLKRIPASVLGHSVAPLVVVDGGADGTERVARELNAPVVVHPTNRGGGAAVRTGLQVANAMGATVAVVIDADGQHDPAELDRVVGPIFAGTADFVSGSRVLGKYEREGAVRAVGVTLFSALATLLIHQKVTDVSNGYRAYRIQKMPVNLLRQDQYYTAEHLIYAVKAGLVYREVPVTISRRQHGKTKKGANVKYAMGFMMSMWRAWSR